jgi:hypothetical protein
MRHPLRQETLRTVDVAQDVDPDFPNLVAAYHAVISKAIIALFSSSTPPSPFFESV